MRTTQQDLVEGMEWQKYFHKLIFGPGFGLSMTVRGKSKVYDPS